MPTDLSELLGRARAGGRNRIAVAAAGDMHVLEAVRAAAEAGIAEAVLVGAKDGILAAAREIRMDPGGWEIIDIPDPAEACRKAVALVREGRAEILMKGLVSTALLMKAVLDKEGGCLLYTSDAADDLLCVDLGGRGIIKKKKKT